MEDRSDFLEKASVIITFEAYSEYWLVVAEKIDRDENISTYHRGRY